jgi:hypothetical protein
MANPNLLLLTTTTVNLAILELTTSAADVIPAVASDTAIEVNSIFATNIHASVVGLVTVIVKRSGTDHILCNLARVPVKQIPVNVIAAGRTIYLQEGDSIRAFANAINNVVIFAPFSEMT